MTMPAGPNPAEPSSAPPPSHPCGLPTAASTLPTVSVLSSAESPPSRPPAAPQPPSPVHASSAPPRLSAGEPAALQPHLSGVVPTSSRPVIHDVDAIKSRFKDEGFVEVLCVIDGPGSHYDVHAHPTLNAYYFLRGSCTVYYPSLQQRIDYHAGDRFEIPADVAHETLFGGSGGVFVVASRMPSASHSNHRSHNHKQAERTAQAQQQLDPQAEQQR